MENINNLRFRWNGHVPHLSKVFSEQRIDEQYCDTTLVSEDGYIIKAHCIILTMTSGYFERTLRNISTDQHPIMILDGVNYKELSCIMDYIYQGMTQVDQALIPAVLDLADLLEIKGLSKIKSNSSIRKLIAPSSVPVPQNDQSSGSSSPANHKQVYSPVSAKPVLKVDTEDNDSNGIKKCLQNGDASSDKVILNAKDIIRPSQKSEYLEIDEEPQNSLIDSVDQTLGIDLSLSKSGEITSDKDFEKSLNLQEDTPLRKRKIILEKQEEIQCSAFDPDFGKLDDKNENVPYKKKKRFGQSSDDVSENMSFPLRCWSAPALSRNLVISSEGKEPQNRNACLDDLDNFSVYDSDMDDSFSIKTGPAGHRVHCARVTGLPSRFLSPTESEGKLSSAPRHSENRHSLQGLRKVIPKKRYEYSSTGVVSYSVGNDNKGTMRIPSTLLYEEDTELRKAPTRNRYPRDDDYDTLLSRFHLPKQEEEAVQMNNLAKRENSESAVPLSNVLSAAECSHEKSFMSSTGSSPKYEIFSPSHSDSELEEECNFSMDTEYWERAFKIWNGSGLSDMEMGSQRQSTPVSSIARTSYISSSSPFIDSTGSPSHILPGRTDSPNLYDTSSVENSSQYNAYTAGGRQRESSSSCDVEFEGTKTARHISSVAELSHINFTYLKKPDDQKSSSVEQHLTKKAEIERIFRVLRSDRRKNRVQIKRPLNRVSLFFKEMNKAVLAAHPHIPNNKRMEIVHSAWKTLSTYEKNEWKKRARELNEEFHRQHPDFVFDPEACKRERMKYDLKMLEKRNLISLPKIQVIPVPTPPSTASSVVLNSNQGPVRLLLKKKN